MNPSLLLPAMGEYLDRLGSLALVRQPVWAKENSEIKPFVLHLKKLTLCRTYSVVEVLGKYIKWTALYPHQQ